MKFRLTALPSRLARPIALDRFQKTCVGAPLGGASALMVMSGLRAWQAFWLEATFCIVTSTLPPVADAPPPRSAGNAGEVG